MSKKPYIVQEDSPNLVIVPTDGEGFYEPTSKKVKLASDSSTSQIYNSSVFAKKCSAKSKFNGVNNDVLIDVSKVQKPTSWATNFLHSIGGSSTKFTRIYSSMPKSPSLHKNYNQLENNTDLVPNTTQITYKTNTNTETNQSIMEEKKTAPKINMNLIQPKPKPALQSTFTKEASQSNSKTKSYQSKMDTSKNKAVHKEPSLPKHYKIPMHSKNKSVIQPVMDKESIRPNSIKDTCQESQPIVSSSMGNSDIQQFKKNTLMPRESTSNKSIHPKGNKDPNQSKHELIKTVHPETDREKTRVKTQINQSKTKKIKVRQSNENLQNRPKYDKQIVPPQGNKETAQPIRNKENSQPKHYKEMKTLPKTYKEPCLSKTSKEIACLKTKENIAQLTNIKEKYKIQNKQEPTFSTKLKTKKEHIKVKSNKISKISQHNVSKSKHSQESKLKKYKDKTHASEKSNLPQNIKENVTKLKKKRTPEKESAAMAEYSDSKNENIKSSDVKTKKKEKSRATNEERLSKSISPIKSVVSKIKSDHQSHNSEKLNRKEKGYYNSHSEQTSCTDFDYVSQKPLHRGSGVDLRTKLKRKLTNNNYSKEDKTKNKKNKFASVANGQPFVPEENLIISFNTEDDNEENVTMKKSPVKKMTRKQPSGGNKRKKIKLEINIVFGQAETTDDESINSNDDTKEEPLENMDLSFLDDFNVDEIVESLNECGDCSIKTNNTEHLPAAAVTVQNSVSSETQKIETMITRQDNALLNKSEIMVKTEVYKEISSMENKIENLEPASQPIVNKHRPCHGEEIHSRINSGISTVKKEVDIHPETELTQNLTFQETNISMSQVLKVNSSLENIQVHQKTNTPNKDKLHEAIISKLQISDSNSKINYNKRSTTSLNNATVVEKTPTSNDTLLVTKIEPSEKPEIIAGTIEIKPQIAHSETHVTDLSSLNIIHPDHEDSDTLRLFEINANDPTTASMNINLQADKINLTTNQMLTTITQHSNTIEKTEAKATGSAPTQRLNDTSTYIKEESDIITIDDSESENETEIKNNQPVKDENTKDLHSNKESPLDSSDDVIIIEPTMAENSESILILDTDYNIEENGDTKSQSKESENQNLAELKIDVKPVLDDNLNTDKTVLEHNSVEIITHTTEKTNTESEKISFDNQASKEMKPDIPKTEEQPSKVENVDISNNVKIANTPNTITSDESSSKTTTKMDTVISEECSPKKTVVNTKQQNANTQLVTKAPSKSSPQDNSENKDKGTKNNDKVNRSLADVNFVQKAEMKLFFFMRQKCTITDVIRIGKFSKIYLCRNSSKQEFALKALKTGCEGVRPTLKEQFQKEKILMKLQNGVPACNLNCIRLIKGFVICGLLCYLMEYYPKNLQQAFAENKRSFHIDDVQVLSRQLVSAVTILRNNNIIHSDIKPSHILINAAQTRIKLCGFDQACYIEDSILLPNTGTVNYRAPELILGYPAGYGIDVWSTALVMYEMATNRKLFPGIYNNNILYQQLCTLGSIPMEMLSECKFRHTHFKGTAFARIMGSNGERIIINEITFNGKIDSILFKTYASEWGHGRVQAGRRDDEAKLSAFSELLQSMLVMHPRYRIAIEFVFANPFIYECFDNDY